MKDNYSVIMAGGIGSRFWPMSTEAHPKQFLDVLGIGKTLIQMTFERLLAVSPVENIYVLTNKDYKDLVLEQLPLLNASQVLTEPERKNTAPCIAYAAAKIYSLNSEANLIVSPADHLIIQTENFTSTIHAGLISSEKGRIATIGIAPTRPDTGYGYIEFESSSQLKPNDVVPVQQFREKPDLLTAQQFLDAGNFYWNSGIFIWKASTILESLKTFQSSLYELFAGDLSNYNSPNEQEYVNNAFCRCEDISVDFAIMEHATNIDVVLSNFDWSDLGTWGSLDTHLEKDASNNAVVGKGVHLFGTSNCIVNVPENNTVIIDGLENYIIVQSENRLMILKKENEQALKNYLQAIVK